MKTKLSWLLTAVTLAVLLSPVMAKAEGITCGNPNVVNPDGRVIEGTIPNGATYYFFWGVVTGRSYSVEALLPFVPFSNGSIVLNMSVGVQADCPQATATVTDSRIVEPILGYTTAASNANRRASAVVTAVTSGPYLYALVNNATGSTQTYNFRVADTTQFSPAWTTNSTYNTFYSLFNTTSSTCTGTLTLSSLAGAVITTAPLSITAGATTSTNTQALGTTRDMTGTAKLTHNCPPGAILAEAAIANFSFATPYFQFVHFQPTREQ